MATNSSEEEQNFTCLQQLVNLSQKAVKEWFDLLFPPITLANTLQANFNKLKRLYDNKHLRDDQWNILFPTTGAVTSKDFDLTLMICIVRNLTKIVPPKKGYDKLPEEWETGGGAAIARIKYYRNQLAHSKSHEINTEVFKSIWKTLSEAIINIGGEKYRELCENVKMKNIKPETKHSFTMTNYDYMYDSYNPFLSEARSSLYCPCYDTHQVEIQEWEKTCKLFVQTDASEFILSTLKTENIITLTGVSGMGKSITMQYIALDLRDKRKYSIIPCKFPVDIMNHFRANRKQVFVIDDLCGQCVADQIEVENWLRNEQTILNILNLKKTKIIAASRLLVYKEKQFQRLKLFTARSCNLSKDFTLSSETKLQIFWRNFPKQQTHFENLVDGSINSLPLLFLFNRRVRNIKEILSNPYKSFFNEMDILRDQSDSTKYCALFLCIVFNGHISETLFTSQQGEVFMKLLGDVSEVCSVSRYQPCSRLHDQLDALVDTYLKKVGEYYEPKHPTIFDYLCLYFGERMIKDVIKYADSKVLRYRTRFHSITDTAVEYIISIDSFYEKDYFDRLIRDVSNHKVIDVFCNNQMELPEYRSKFIAYLKTIDSEKIIQIVNTTDAYDDPVTPLFIAAKNGYFDVILFLLEYTENLRSIKDYLPLNAACSRGQKDLVTTLIERGADKFQTSCLDGRNCFHEACLTGQLLIVKYLIGQYNDIQDAMTKDHQGLTPLDLACEFGHIDVVKSLLEYHLDVNDGENQGSTSLFMACQNGHKQVVDLLITHGANVSKETITVCPLAIASQMGHTEIVLKLLDAGAEVNKTNSLGHSALQLASNNGQREIVEILLGKGADIDKPDMFGFNPLTNATKNSHREVVELLVRKGANINHTTSFHSSAVMEASCIGSEEIVKYLFNNGANLTPNGKNGLNTFIFAAMGGQVNIMKYIIGKDKTVNCHIRNGWDALLGACKYGKVDAVDFLISSGDNVNSSDMHGNTALMIACFFGQIKVAKMLIDNGAYVNKTNRYGHSPLIVASRITDKTFVTLLLEKGAMINKADNSGCTPLMHACGTENFEVVALLLSSGANLNGKDKCKWTPLMWLCKNAEDRMVQLVLSKGIAIDQQDENGCTALMIACFNSNLSAVHTLLDNNANINIMDCQHWSALMWACRGNNKEIVRLLIERGANVNIVPDGGKTPFLWATEVGNDIISDLLAKQTVEMNRQHTWAKLMWSARKGLTSDAKTCIGKGVDVNMSNMEGITPLIVACTYGRLAVVALLLRNDVQINKPDNRGWVPLKWATTCHHEDIARFLVANGATINGNNNTKQLIWSCKHQQEKLVTFLIEEGVHVNCTNDFGRTPLMGAAKVGNHSIVAKLLENGADINKTDFHNVNALMEACSSGHNDIVGLLLTNKCNINNTDDRGYSALAMATIKGHKGIVENLIKKNAFTFIMNKKGWLAVEEARLRGYREIVKILEME